MKNHWFSLFATTAALALAVVAPAQDRGRRSGGGSERSSPSRTAPSRSEPSRTAPSRGSDSRSRGNDATTRSRADRGTPWNQDRSGRDSRTSDPRGSSDRRTSPWDGRGRDTRPNSPWGDRDGRRNPFDRSAVRPDRSPFGGNARLSSRYDGRGNARPTWYGAPPNRPSLNVQIRRTNARTGYNVSFGGTYGGLRVGYVSYGGYRRNDWSLGVGFGYPYYAYDPFAPDCVVVASPWYRYSYLPPYIDNRRVVVVNNYPSTWDTEGWRDYDYRDEDRGESVRGALDDLRDAFEQNRESVADRLVPDSGQVAIYNDGKYDYSLQADDFRKMFLDGVGQSKTSRYEILETRSRGDEVRVRARHTFEDSWGETRSVIHTITLRRDRGGDFVIREFGSE